MTDKEVQAINTEEALASHERVSKVVEYIIEHFDQKTKRSSFYDLKGQRVNGFNSMFAVASIPMAKKYYLEFKKQLEELLQYIHLRQMKKILQMVYWMMKDLKQTY